MDAHDPLHSDPRADDSSTGPAHTTHTAPAARRGWLSAALLPLAAIAVIGAAGSGSVSRALFPVTVLPAIHVQAGAGEPASAPLGSFEDVATAEIELPEPAIELAAPAVAAQPPIDLFPDTHTQVGDLIERNGIRYRVDDVILMEVTAYCPCKKCCGPLAHGVTASGKPVSYNNGRFVAADIRVLPFDSEIRIPGYHGTAGEIVEVIDRGGAIKGRKLDVYFPDHQTALKWGRQTLPVQVLERVD